MKRSEVSKAVKKPTNVSVDVELLAEARKFNINLSATLDAALHRAVAERKREEWLRQNQEGLLLCNEVAEEYGLFSDEHREL
ncbi:type II toxin-antitoxin system CcdA family antitoxin [Serratia oryzae]|uniref:type II toxin-antitoxin system CcdA family antitoxin n=1 Tax=Serratia oryzae TaxID=2034155 RepID=UPI0012E1676B|nr:type II toxin-antitoxin system CcdA family antitoxin [Serratia oryzae]VXD07274.1 Plasmid maintenance protein CcdB [Enterobacterales bacterium 8AC]